MRRLVFLVVLAACGGDDGDWVVRPPGGGGGGHVTPIDAPPSIDAADDASEGGLTGVVCVVDDLRRPELCPIVPAAVGVLVRRAGDVDGALSGDDARFTLALADPLVVLEVGAGSATLQLAVVPAINDGRLIHAPVPTAAAWTATAASLDVSIGAGTGAIALYVDEPTGTPAQGVIVNAPPGALVEPFYDGSSTTAWRPGGGTGPFGAVLLVDLQPGTYALDGAQGARLIDVSGIPVTADAVTFIRARLPS